MTPVPPAELDRRILAGLLDAFLLSAVFVVLAVGSGGTGASGQTVVVSLDGGAFLAFVVVALGYHFACEAASGRTLGKLAFGLRVVRWDGERAGPGAVAVRTLLRLVDVLPLYYVAGLLCVLASGPQRRARLGDLAARTVVVEV